MKENILLFRHEVFGEIRTLTGENGETFFVGKDVAKALGYSNNNLHQRERSLLSHPLIEVGTGEGVQALGDECGAASDKDDGRLHSYSRQRGPTAF